MSAQPKFQYLWDINNPRGYYNRMGLYKTNVELLFIKKFLRGEKVPKVLDLGGGSGRFAVPLKKEGCDITVLDLDENAINLCKERGIEKSFCLDIREYSELNFDLVLAIELFLVTTPLDVIKVAERTLKPNGIFITVGSNKLSWRYKLRSLRKKKSKNYDEFSLHEYRVLFANNGFEIIEIMGFNWMPFKVNSNNLLISIIAKLETKLKLHKWLNQSPWFLFACKKKSN